MKAQVSLTVHEAKRIIGKGIAMRPEVQNALKSGKIFLKGGTTVSAVCEELIGKPLLIAGRISPKGTIMAHNFSGQFHSALIVKGELRAVGLTPIVGQIMTEKEAVALLGNVSSTVIGKGGIAGAEGGTTLQIEGEKREVEKVFQIIQSSKGAQVSGISESLPGCVAPHEKCKVHRGCIYKKAKSG